MNLILNLIQADKSLQTVLRKNESRDGCELCGKKHALAFGGEAYCQSIHHFARGPEWSTPVDPMTDAELVDLHAQIVREKNAKYPGGYSKWCDDRGISELKR